MTEEEFILFKGIYIEEILAEKRTFCWGLKFRGEKGLIGII